MEVSDAEIEKEMEKFRLLVSDASAEKELDYVDHVINQASDNIAVSDDLGETYAKWLQLESYQTNSNFPSLPTKFTSEMDTDEKIEFISDTMNNLGISVDEIGLICNDSVEKMDVINERLSKIEKTLSRMISMLERIVPQGGS